MSRVICDPTYFVLERGPPLVPSVTIMDNLREWMGYDHNEATDCRGTKAEIERRFDADVRLTFTGTFPEEDEMFEVKIRAGESVRELWIDVDERMREGLDLVWRDDPAQTVAIVANNRSIQSLLRLVGCPCGVEQLEEEFGISNMQNAAVIPLLVTRSTDPRAFAQWETDCARFRRLEGPMIIQQRKRDYEEGEQVARELSEDEAAKFARLLGAKELDEFKAHRNTG